MRRAAKTERPKHRLSLSLRPTLVVAICSGLSISVAAATAALMIADIWNDELLNGWLEWLSVIAVFAVGWLGYQFTRLWFSWRWQSVARKKAPAARLGSDRAPLKRGFLELFAYFLLSLASLATIAFLSTEAAFGKNIVLLGRADDVAAHPVHLAIFLALFACSFTPLLFGFFLQARADAQARHQPMLRDDVVSPTSFLVIAAALWAVILLAWAAAGHLFSMTNDFGVIVTLLVILAFLAIIIGPHIARYWNDRSEEIAEARPKIHHNSALPIDVPAKLLSRIDSVLVRVIAPFSGVTQNGFGLPHLLLIGTMIPLSALGYVLASPFGLIPIGVAMLIALALGRRWAWLEEDRETASRLQSTQGHEIFIGFENDLKDEALLGYACLFVLVPLALSQLQDWTHSFNAVAGATSGNAFIDWLRFFGAELAKAVPFVDWWEVYNVPVTTPFDTQSAAPLAKHLTFAARALVDLVIMSALVQALGIWQRARTQNRLYDSGQLDHFDPFTELAFFETGMQSRRGNKPVPKKNFLKRIEDHVVRRAALGQTPLPYNQRRLAELIDAESRDVSEGAKWMIANYGVLAGPPRIQLEQLNQRWLLFQLPLLVASGNAADLAIVRSEKLEFERVIVSLRPDCLSLTSEDVGKILQLLDVTKGAPEFSYGQSLAYELLGTLVVPEAIVALSLHLLEGRHYETRSDWRDRTLAFTGFPRPLLYLSKADARIRVLEALRDIGLNQLANRDMRVLALKLLEWMGTEGPTTSGETGDRASSARQSATECAEEVRRALGEHLEAPE